MKLDSLRWLATVVSVVFVLGSGVFPADADARRGGGGRAHTSVHKNVNVNRNRNVNRNVSRGTNVNRNTNVNVNRNVNRNTNVNVNRNVNVHHHDNYWRRNPVGTAAAVAATAIVVGSIVYSLPPSCSTVIVGDITYQQCGSTWYQPRYIGSDVEYVVVNSPR